MPSWALHVLAVIVGAALSLAALSRAPRPSERAWHAVTFLAATVAAPSASIDGAVVQDGASDARVRDHAGASVCVLASASTAVAAAGPWRWLTLADRASERGHRPLLVASQRAPPV